MAITCLEIACCLLSSQNGSGNPWYIQVQPVLPVHVVECSSIPTVSLMSQSRRLDILARIMLLLGIGRRWGSILCSATSDFSGCCSRYFCGVPWPWSGYTDRFAQCTLATREGNVTYTRWFKGQIFFDGTRQPENLTEWKAEVLKMIWQNSAQAVKCVLHNCQESYYRTVVMWWSDTLWRVQSALKVVWKVSISAWWLSYSEVVLGLGLTVHNNECLFAGWSCDVAIRYSFVRIAFLYTLQPKQTSFVSVTP